MSQYLLDITDLDTTGIEFVCTVGATRFTQDRFELAFSVWVLCALPIKREILAFGDTILHGNLLFAIS